MRGFGQLLQLLGDGVQAQVALPGLLQCLHDLFGHGLGFLLFDLLHVVRSGLDRVIRRVQDFFFAAQISGDSTPLASS